MKDRIISTTFAMLLCLVLLASQAQATWYWTHGNSGHVEDESAVSWARKGYGLEVNPAWQPSTWVHFAVPTIGETGTGARYVSIKFDATHAVDSRISRVRVYNGDILVKTFTVSWSTTGFQNKKLDLGSVRTFGRGLGVSVEITAGPDSGIDQFVFISAGANFVPMP
ncbi:MAG: hypothetical protein WC291_01375 [Thermodesulfovibrionales bacterium]